MMPMDKGVLRFRHFAKYTAAAPSSCNATNNNQQDQAAKDGEKGSLYVRKTAPASR